MRKIPLLRELLAALLLFGGEILLWLDPPSRSLVDWLLIVAGYEALAYLLLDLAARLRWRDIFGTLALAGIFALLNGLLINPQTSFAEFPRTLFTRVLGAQALVAVGMLILWRVTLTPKRGRPVIAVVISAIIGAAWGTWARWSAGLLNPQSAQLETPISTLLIAAGIVIALIFVLRHVIARREVRVETSSFKLGRVGWLFTATILITLLIMRLASGQIDALMVAFSFTLLMICVAILYAQRRKKWSTFLDTLQPSPAPPLTWTVPVIIAFIIGALIGYPLPRGEGNQDPVFVITALFTGYGIAWLPAAALALGLRAFVRQAQINRL